VVLLNKAIVRGKIDGPQAGLAEYHAIPKVAVLETQNYLFPATLAEFHTELGDLIQAKAYLEKAVILAPTTPEKRLMKRKLEALK
jgi:predicted RNA polymerase sigma factor